MISKIFNEITFYWVFVNESLNQFMILSEAEFDGDRRWDLFDEGWDVLWDSALSRKQAKEYVETYYPDLTTFQPRRMPISFKQARLFINAHHRHHISPHGHKFSIAVSDGQNIIGVVVVGRPVSKHRDTGFVAEVTRLCVKSAFHNLCSLLYRAASKVAKEMGYEKLITYTLEEEAGGSLKAAGFNLCGVTQGGSWDSPKRRRRDKHPTGKKKIWELALS